MMPSSMPILYSFRRCPYAMRARLALVYSGVVCELREVVLKSKPPALLAVSPKATVPVLVVGQQVIDQSIEIIDWALTQSDPDNWLEHSCDHELIVKCDEEFKHWLDHYKYADRFPEYPPKYYFEKACEYLQIIENELTAVLDSNEKIELPFCIANSKVSSLDVAIFPFVRQFAFVDKAAFDELDMPKLQAWLDGFLTSTLFETVMPKYPMWVEGESQRLVFGQIIN